MSSDNGTAGVSSTWSWRVTNYSILPESEEAVSWVRCSVQGRPGAVVHLSSVPSAAVPVALTAQAGSRPEYGPDFCELGPVGAGQYTLSVEGTDVAVDLWLDGKASASVVLTPSQIPHVLFLGQLMAHQGNFLALTRYVARFGAVVTFDVDEAIRAAHAILIGAPHLVGDEIEGALQQAGVRVERAQGDIAAQLDQAVEAGTPYLSP